MITDNLEVEIPVVVGEDGVTTIQLLTADITQLNIVKDEFGKTYLSGTVILTGIYFDLILQQRVNRSITQLLVRYSDYEGLMNTNGLYHYDTGVCELSVGDTETFDSIINLEFKPTNVELDFEFNSYNVKRYATDGYTPVTYQECSGVTPLPYNPNTTYQRALYESSSGAWIGDDSDTCYYNGNYYFSLESSNTGNQPDISPTKWELPTGLNPKTYGQERSKYVFDEEAEYDEYNKYWYLPNCGSGFYTAQISGINIKTELENQLQAFDFDLDPDWLDYPKSINSLYENKLWLASTELKTTCTAYELIEAIQQTFNCVYVVENNLLKFIWKGERYNNWDNSLPIEHNLINIDIFDWSNSEDRNVKRHILKFTESDLGTHDNSIIEYENNYIDDASVEPSFDVDLTYSFNKGDTPCLVTTNEDNEVDEFNTALIPSFLHETFYFVDREFNTGVFNGNSVTLQLGYFETTDRELQGSYDIDNWNMEYQILINNLALSEQFAICEEVTYSIENNNYTLKLKTKN